MGSLENPRPWVPYYLNTRDCSQGLCSLYCPQWCYLIFPPPPPIELPGNHDSGSNFSPQVIAIIGILATAFLLVSYYAIVKYCYNSSSGGGEGRRRREDRSMNEELEDQSNYEPWQSSTTGLDEAQIKSIAVLKYKKGEFLIDGPDCSVCLGEFQEDERLRLLPKCGHAFHLPCIDKWLRSQATCPLCRADVISAHPTPPPPPPPPPPPAEEPLAEQGLSGDEIFKSPVRVLSELRISEQGDAIIEIGEYINEGIRRSVSMGFNFRVSRGDLSQCVYRRSRVLHCVMSPVSMKRSSSSSARFSFQRRNRGQNMVIPL